MEISELIDRAASKFQINKNLLTAVLLKESKNNPNAVSPKGATGIAQLMPATAKEIGVTDPTDPAQSVEGGAKYLRQMLDRYHGNTRLALAAYNAGPGKVDLYGDVPPYQETQDYVSTIMGKAGNPVDIKTLGAQIQKARAAGYSSDEIVQYLGSSHPEIGPGIQKALESGYKADEILAHLTPPPVSAVPGMERLGGNPPGPAKPPVPPALQKGADPTVEARREQYRETYHQEPPAGYGKPGFNQQGLDELSGAALGTGLAAKPLATGAGLVGGATSQKVAEAAGAGPKTQLAAGVLGGILSEGATTGSLARFARRAGSATSAATSSVVNDAASYSPFTGPFKPIKYIPNAIKAAYQGWKASSPGAMADAARARYLDAVAKEVTGSKADAEGMFSKLPRDIQNKVLAEADALPTRARQEMEMATTPAPPPNRRPGWTAGPGPSAPDISDVEPITATETPTGRKPGTGTPKPKPAPREKKPPIWEGMTAGGTNPVEAEFEPTPATETPTGRKPGTGEPKIQPEPTPRPAPAWTAGPGPSDVDLPDVQPVDAEATPSGRKPGTGQPNQAAMDRIKADAEARAKAKANPKPTTPQPPAQTPQPPVQTPTPATPDVYSQAGNDLASKYAANAAAKDKTFAGWLKSQNIDAPTFSKATLDQKNAWAKKAGFRRFSDPQYEGPRTDAVVGHMQARPGETATPNPSGPQGTAGGEVPFFAEGGVITRPTLGVIGEAGPEKRVPLTSDQPTVPEKADTLQEQMKQLAAGSRRVVMFPKGQPLMARPKGMKSYQDASGNTFIFNPKLTSQPDIDKAEQENRLPELLGATHGGMGAPDKSRLQGEAKVVEGKTKDGISTQSTATDSHSLPSAIQQTKKVTPKDGTIEVKKPEDTIADRKDLGDVEAPDKKVDTIRGSINVPLDDEGLKQADHLGRRFAAKGGVHRVISSDLMRARQTAEGVKRHNPGAKMTYTDKLQPWPLGGLEGTPTGGALPELKRLVNKAPSEVPKGRNPESTKPAQSFNRFRSRALSEIIRRKEEHDRVAPNEVWVLQAHKSLMRLMQSWSKKGAPRDLTIDKKHFFGGDDEPASVLSLDDYKKVDKVNMDSPGKLRGGVYLARHGSTSYNAPSSNKAIS